MMKKTTMMIAALVAMTTLTACGTVQGVASDTWGAGKFIARQVSGD